MDAVLSKETRAGLSVHWRRATAKVSRNGGEIEARGAGVGLSATWSPGPFFVDGQAAATLYDVDLDSALHGSLKDDAEAQGLSAALEAGRMVPMADGVTVTPRARVSLDRGPESDRSRRGAGGACLRLRGRGARVRGGDADVAGMSLEATDEETRRPVDVEAGHGWEEGRFAPRWTGRRPAAMRATTAPAPASRCASDRHNGNRRREKGCVHGARGLSCGGNRRERTTP